MTDSLQNMTSMYGMKQSRMEFEEVRDYCTSLSEKLITLDKVNQRIHKERQGMYSEERTISSILINSKKIIFHRLFV